MTWRCGKLADESTPYALGFRVGMHVHLQDRGPFAIVYGDSAIRFVTRYQADSYIVADGCDRAAQAEADYQRLRRSLLASPFGYLDSLHDVHPRIRPPQVPAVYKGMKVLVSDTAPMIRQPGWMGEHLLDSDLKGTIYLEASYVHAILAKRRLEILAETLEHEYREAGFELALARQEYPGAKPRQLGGLCLVMNGLAHRLTIKPETEQAYNSRQDRERKALGLLRAA